VSVHVVIVNWNGAGDTLRCLASVDALDGVAPHVVVVDNGSTDGSADAIRAARPDVELVQTGANLGYAGGANAGIGVARAAGARYVWLLNNDTRVDPRSLAALVEAADADARCGALAPRVIDEPEGVQADVAFVAGPGDAPVPDGGRPFPLNTFLPPNARQVPIRCTGCDAARPYHPADVLRGPSLLLRVEALAQVGGLDTSYFHYYEEVDLVARLLAAGWRAGFVCGARVVHEEGASLSGASAQAQYYTLRNYLMFRRRHFSERALRVLARDTLMGRRLVSVRGLARLDGRPTRAGLLAVADALRGRSGQRDLGERYR
jgi:GT2 family glycosyltransferase